jgi:hypothetical protein
MRIRIMDFLTEGRSRRAIRKPLMGGHKKVPSGPI